MRRLLLSVTVLALSGLGFFVPGAATPTPARSLSVTGTGVAMYPAFDAATERYGLTTTAATAGSVDVTATTADPAGVVLVDGRRTTSPSTHLTGLTTGDEISVVIDDAGGRTAYSVVYLPAGFPAFEATGTGPVAAGYLGVGLTTFAGDPSFEALLDRNGVPAWVRSGVGTDLKRQPSGELTISRLTTAAGHTGYDLVTLDDQLAETSRRHVVGDLTDTDNHDSERLSNGNTILIGYEPRGDCGTGFLDATIQEQDPAGNVVFEWNSQGLETESLNPMPWPPTGPCQRTDYAHINSVQEIPDGSHDLLVSFRHLSAVYRISTDPANTDPHHIVWSLGGRHSSFSFAVGDGGPCAQHNATWVAPDHVLLFDNGSATLGASVAGCVDPSDPSGPGISRVQTRVIEYTLDTAAHTATIARSYEPAGAFTFFAGSASRLSDDHTLIGWASDRLTFATEVDASMAPVWSLSIPGNSHNVGYTSYRVSLVDYVDKIAPAVDAGPVDPVYVAGDAVTAPAYSCTDRGGSSLQTCTVTGATDGLLDTATPGPHTWQVTAEDGAGNTTTAVRQYTVRPPGRLADGSVRRAGSTRWKGAGVVGAPTTQTVREAVRRTHAAVAHWRIANAGERADAFRLVGTGSSRRFRVRYVSGGADVTAAVVAGTFRTPTLAPGQSVTLRVVVTPTRRAAAGRTRATTLAAVSVGDPTRVDRVATSVTVRR